ncbi:SseB family protein [Micromonospora citrea]|uniref:SseB family protein n=1 Tax=Micromonospora citrea TaxID=47855 RepID=UPI000B867DCE|nr:SseB family protein [Micromonospora citrea]
MTEWEPATDAEAAMRDALRASDQQLYFRILAGTELLLPVSAEALAGRAPMGWGTWTTGGRTHVLAFTSAGAMRACLGEHAGTSRRTTYADLAAGWPNHEWWLAVNPGLPIEGYLPAWFVAQLSRGDVRLPGRTLGARARLERAETVARARAQATGHDTPGGPGIRPTLDGAGRAGAAPGLGVPPRPDPMAGSSTGRAAPARPGPPPEPLRTGVPPAQTLGPGDPTAGEPAQGDGGAAVDRPAPSRFAPLADRAEGRPLPPAAQPVPPNGRPAGEPAERPNHRSFFEPASGRASAQRQEALRSGERAVPPSRLARGGQPFPRRRPLAEPVPEGPTQPFPVAPADGEPTRAFAVTGGENTQVLPSRRPDGPAEDATRELRVPAPDPAPTYAARRPEPDGDATQALPRPRPTPEPAEEPVSAAEPVSGPPAPRRGFTPIVIEGTVIESREITGPPGGAADEPVSLFEPVRRGDRSASSAPASPAPGRADATSGPGRPTPVAPASDAPFPPGPGGPVDPQPTGPAHPTPGADGPTPDPVVPRPADPADPAAVGPARADLGAVDPALAGAVAPASAAVVDPGPLGPAHVGPAPAAGEPWPAQGPAGDVGATAGPTPGGAGTPPAESGLTGAPTAEPAPAGTDDGSRDPDDGPAGAGGTTARAEAVPADFQPANEVEENLLDAAGAGSTDTFLSTLLLARVLLPVAADSTPGSRPGEPGFVWRTQELDGETFVVVHTSPERLAEHTDAAVETVEVRFVQLIRRWPDESWSFAVNPGSPVGAKLPGEQIVALANWAAEVGLGDDTGAESEPSPPAEEPVSRPRYAAPDPARPIVMQKAVAPSQLAYYLERGYDRVSGFVHRANELAHLNTPAQLHDALGLGYPESPFARDAEEIYVLRWPAHRPSLYRIPYGGQNEAAMRAMEGWVIERPPFRGNGFAPGESSDVVAEFKVDSARLPHGAQLWRIGADGSERVVAILDTDALLWRQVGEQ